jgi:glycosyltransferase involved in cell wall biosynthesis
MGPEAEEVLRGWAEYLAGLGRDHEVLVANTGSDGRIAEIAQGLVAKYPTIRPLPNSTAGGIGASLRISLAAANYPLLFYADGSRCYQPADLNLLLEAIDKVDIVSGYRVWHKGSRSQALTSRWLARLFFGVRLRDPDCSFKLFRRSIFARIPIQSDGPFVHAEILAKANFLGCLMNEVPVTFREDQKTAVLPRTRWADARRVFFHPDFGPAVLSEQASKSPA